MTSLSSDVEEELRRYKQRCEVLERDNALLSSEKEFASSFDNRPVLGDDEHAVFQDTLLNLTQQRQLSTQLAEKLITVRRIQQLDRAAIGDIRRELDEGSMIVRRVALDSINAINSIHSDYIAKKRDLAIERRENGSLNSDLRQLKEDQVDRINKCNYLQAKLKEALAKICNLEERAVQAEALRVEELFSSNIAVETLRADIATLQNSSSSAAECAALQLQLVRDNAAAAAEVAASLRGQQQDLLRARDDALRDSATQRQRYEQLQHEKSRLEVHIDGLQARVDELAGQQERLFAENSSLQSTLTTVLRREGDLRAEMCSSSADKGDLQRRLNSISEKVRAIEAEHQVEMERLQCELDVAIEQRDSATLHSAQLQKVNAELDFRVRDIRDCNTSALQRASVEKLAVAEKAAEIERRCERLSGEGETARRALQEAKLQCAALREDSQQLRASEEGAREQLSLLRENLLRAERQLEGGAAERAVMKAERTALQQQLHAAAPQARVQALEEALHEKGLEIDALKQTIHRECEERCEMMIEISDLTDELSRLRSNSGGTHTAAQTSRGSSTVSRPPAEDVDTLPFLSKIVGSRSSAGFGGVFSGDPDNPESDESGVWTNSMAKRLGKKKRDKR